MKAFAPESVAAVDARRILGVRTRLGLSQRELAAELGVTPGAVAHWESGTHPVPGPVDRLLAYYEEELADEQTPGAWREPTENALWRDLASGAALGLVLRGLFAEQAGNPLSRRIRRVVLERYLATLGRMKALPMKLGQMISFLDALGPDDARGAARVATPAMPPRLVARILFDELGRTPDQLFAEWDKTPLAVASIGQVHRARLPSGVEVAVKVQYPRVVRALEQDLKLLARFDHDGHLLLPRQRGGVVFEELRERLAEECNYLIEATNQVEFAARLAGHRHLFVPALHSELSSRRVIVSELVRGRSFDAFADTAPQVARDTAGAALIDFYVGGLYRDGVFNADPHPGNFLFVGAEPRIACLDFGRVKRVSPGFVATIGAIARAVLERDRMGFRTAFLATGYIEREDGFDWGYLMRVMATLLEPALRPGRYRFDVSHLRRVWAIITANPNRARIDYVKDQILLEQVYLGVPALLARLHARVDYRERFLDLVYPSGATHPAPFTEGELALLDIPADGWESP